MIDAPETPPAPEESSPDADGAVWAACFRCGRHPRAAEAEFCTECGSMLHEENPPKVVRTARRRARTLRTLLIREICLLLAPLVLLVPALALSVAEVMTSRNLLLGWCGVAALLLAGGVFCHLSRNRLLRCPACRKRLPGGFYWRELACCPWCGTRIREGTRRHAITRDMQRGDAPGTCSYCGGGMLPDNSFCPTCGAFAPRWVVAPEYLDAAREELPDEHGRICPVCFFRFGKRWSRAEYCPECGCPAASEAPPAGE